MSRELRISKKQFNDLMKSLKSIESNLDLLVRLQKANLPKPKITTEEKKVLKLCDKKHTVSDMMKKIGKTETNVNKLLSLLRGKGVIRSVKKKDKLVYERI